MPNVVADPEKLRQFAGTLTNAAQQLEQLSRQLQRSLDATGWKDSERAKFETDFKATMRSITQASDRLKTSYVPVLQRKATALEQFRT
jgi:predicted  nucleic acid-binding Zn-ribbon protein